MDSGGDNLHVQGFFVFGSLLSIDAYYVEHKAFPKEWVDMKAFLEMYKSDKARAFKDVPRSGVDLMILTIPKGLPMPMVSSLPTSVPVWNFNHANFLTISLALGSTLVHDGGVLLLFHKDDLKLRAMIRGVAKAYHFSTLKEWTGINRVPITSARDPSKTVSACRLVLFFNPSNACM